MLLPWSLRKLHNDGGNIETSVFNPNTSVYYVFQQNFSYFLSTVEPRLTTTSLIKGEVLCPFSLCCVINLLNLYRRILLMNRFFFRLLRKCNQMTFERKTSQNQFLPIYVRHKSTEKLGKNLPGVFKLETISIMAIRNQTHLFNSFCAME